MREIPSHPRLVEQVYEAILAEISDGQLPPNARLIQDDLAAAYGVSRQPVQQALLLLRDRGLVRDAPRRGLVVAPLDVPFVRNLYEVRAVLEGLSARMAAGHGPGRARAEGPPLIEAGRAAVASGSVTGEIAAILDAVAAGDGAKAEGLGRQHIARAAEIFVARLQVYQEASLEGRQRRRLRR